MWVGRGGVCIYVCVWLGWVEVGVGVREVPRMLAPCLKEVGILVWVLCD